MSADQHIDDLFREGLGNHDLGPQMHLWPGVAKQLRKPFLSPRRFALWTLLAIGFTAILPGDQHEYTKKTAESTPREVIASSEKPASYTPNLRVLSQAKDQKESGIRAEDEKEIPGSDALRKTSRRPAKLMRKLLPQEISALAGESAQPTTSGEQDAISAFPEQNGQSTAKRPMPDGVSYLEMRSTPFSPYPVDDVIPPIKFLGERWFAGLDLSYSRDWMQRSLYAKTPDYATYAQLRNTSEAFQSAHSATLRLSLISASGITLRGGIQVAWFNETFAHQTKENVLRFIPRRDATGSIIGTDTILQVVQTNHNSQNRFHTVDIPLTIGYEFPLGKANFSLHAGPVLNMAFYQQGKFLAEDGERIADFSSSTPDAYPAFRNRLGMGFYGSINLSYPLTPSVHFFAEPYLRVFPGSFTNADYPLDQRYRTQGVFLGIRKVIGPYWMNLRP